MSAQERLGFFVAMGGQIVEDDGGTGFDLGYQHVADVSNKGWTVHCPLDDPGCDQIGWTQASNQGLGAPGSKRGGCCKSCAVQGATAYPRQVGFD